PKNGIPAPFTAETTSIKPQQNNNKNPWFLLPSLVSPNSKDKPRQIAKQKPVVFVTPPLKKRRATDSRPYGCNIQILYSRGGY
ncbi:MAG: hypothetical protein II350_06125, partial [Clostridia bacterium]|nr:hypothetical protein [Clostridia bacterium]